MELALGLYAAMALLGLAIFVSIRSTLGRLRRAAQAAESGGTFAGEVTVPEFMPLAVEFDLMVGRLRRAAATLRQAAEDNAHALKGPLAVIGQLVEGLRSEPPDPRDLSAKLIPIDAAVRRLDGLVRSAQRLDSATAELLEGERHPLDLSALVSGFAEEYRLMLGDGAHRLVVEAEPGIEIVGNEETVEVILENLVENALSFTPQAGIVRVALSRVDDKATLIVADEGPGVPPATLPKIFDRYFSSRRTDTSERESEGGAHFGIGLWLVRQHVIGLDGTVAASNRVEGGFEVKIIFPTAPLRQ
jgi:two-component system sensor histidine kinase ChvG